MTHDEANYIQEYVPTPFYGECLLGPKTLISKGAQKYKEDLDEEFKNNQLGVYGKIALESVYSLGLLPIFKIAQRARSIQHKPENREFELRDVPK